MFVIAVLEPKFTRIRRLGRDVSRRKVEALKRLDKTIETPTTIANKRGVLLLSFTECLLRGGLGGGAKWYPRVLSIYAIVL